MLKTKKKQKTSAVIKPSFIIIISTKIQLKKTMFKSLFKDGLTNTTSDQRASDESKKRKNNACSYTTTTTTNSTSNTKKKKRTRPPKKNQHNTNSIHHHSNDISKNKKHKHHPPTKPPSEKAIALSQELKSLSTQKRLKDALNLYYHESNNAIRDEHHACIVIDCCSRCGNIQEGIKIVQSLKENNGGSSNSINVQTKTALLKGYVHSGMVREASLLYQEMNQEKRVRDRPNVRTLNTLLRGCLWSAATCYFHHDQHIKNNTKKKQNNYDVHGGVVTSELIWPRNNNSKNTSSSMQPDLSSFEYSIILLCQAFKIDEAKERINLLQSMYGITAQECRNNDNGDDDDDDSSSSNDGTDGERYKFFTKDPTSLETLAVAYISLSRACTLLNKRKCGEKYANMVTSLSKQMLEHDKHSSSTSSSTATATTAATTTTITSNMKIGGGKRAWKKSNQEHNNNEKNHNNTNEQQESRRDVSNKLFRLHRVSEIQSEAKMILKLCHHNNNHNNGVVEKSVGEDSTSIDLPYYLATRLLYFSGGGTTDLSALQSPDESAKNKEARVMHESFMSHLHSLWFSFGLAQAVKEKYPDLKINVHNNKNGYKLSIDDGKRIGKVINVDMENVLSNNGNINFSRVFTLRDEEKKTEDNNSRPLYVELGSGFGEWAVYQAQNNPSCDYVAVELRADRVSQMFTKAMLNQSGPLPNICSIGSECGHLLRYRIPHGSVSKIFINHPEPPTQTFGSNLSVVRSIAAGGEEPAHMLNSETLLSATKCLKESIGELIIVTDNRWYAKLICSTLLKLMTSHEQDHGLSNKVFHHNEGVQQVDSFVQNVQGTQRQERVNLYEGKPSKAIGHFVPNNDQSGTSYFDRLWKSGAGTHAETKRRFIIAMCKSPLSSSGSLSGSAASKKTEIRFGHTNKIKYKTKPKKVKKRNPEKQKRRNEKRLRKKQQTQQQQQSKEM